MITGQAYKKYGKEIEGAFIEVRKACISSLNYLGEKNVTWDVNTLEKMVREKLSENIEKRFFEEVIDFEVNWILGRLEEERILKGEGEMLITLGQFCKRCHGDLKTSEEKAREVCDGCYYEDD